MLSPLLLSSVCVCANVTPMSDEGKFISTTNCCYNTHHYWQHRYRSLRNTRPRRHRPTTDCRNYFAIVDELVSCASCDDFETWRREKSRDRARLHSKGKTNHVFTWASDKFNALANSTRSGVLRYFCPSNRFSKPFSWWSLKTVRALRRRQCLSEYSLFR